MAKSFPYEDIINLEPHISKKYPQVSMADRAARFSPFAAVTGYEDMVKEAARVTEERVKLDEHARRALDDTLSKIMRLSIEKRTVSITYFVEDTKKTGGAYISEEGIIKRVDEHLRALLLGNGTLIRIEDILEMCIVED